MKRILSVLFAFLMLFALTGCSDQKTESSDKSEKENIVFETHVLKNIGYEVPTNWENLNENEADDMMAFFSFDDGYFSVSNIKDFYEDEYTLDDFKDDEANEEESEYYKNVKLISVEECIISGKKGYHCTKSYTSCSPITGEEETRFESVYVFEYKNYKYKLSMELKGTDKGKDEISKTEKHIIDTIQYL